MKTPSQEETTKLPAKYQDFADVFNKKNICNPLLYQPYDCSIDFKPGAMCPSDTYIPCLSWKEGPEGIHSGHVYICI